MEGICMTTIVISDPIHADAIEMLLDHGYTVLDMSTRKDELVSVLDQAEGIVVRSATKVTPAFLDNCPNLKIIGRSGVGLDNIDLDECKQREIKVVNSPEGPTRSVAELALVHMLTASRKFGIVMPGTKAGEWPKKEKGNEIFGKTLGIIGSGAIGGQLARYAIALGMNVIAYDIIEYDELNNLDQFRYVELDELYSTSDIISIHVPLLDATHHMIDKEAINKMKQGVIIVNTSRGGIIDEEALYEGLQQGKVAGVGLDVYEQEPVTGGNPLVSHPLVVTTPHIGAQTPEASRRNSTIISEKLIKYLG